jgi:hypothetical protein
VFGDPGTGASVGYQTAASIAGSVAVAGISTNWKPDARAGVAVSEKAKARRKVIKTPYV